MYTSIGNILSIASIRACLLPSEMAVYMYVCICIYMNVYINRQYLVHRLDQSLFAVLRDGCMYVCAYVCKYVCVCGFVHVHICIHLAGNSVHAHKHMYLHTYKCVFTYAYIHASTNSLIYAVTCMYTHLCIHIHMYIHMHTYMHKLTIICKYVIQTIEINSYVFIHIRICICIYAYIHTCKSLTNIMQVCGKKMQRYEHTHIYIHTYMHACKN